MRRLASAVCAALLVATLLASCSSSEPAPIRVGALYPLSGPQARGGGVDEYRGVRLAVDLVNQDGGVDGRPVRLDAVDVPGSDAAEQGIDHLAASGIRVVLGSYGSTISAPASVAAAERRMLFWETGAVGETMAESQGDLVFRMPPTGSVLGGSAVSFIADHLAPILDRKPESLRFAVANVDDVYGNSVAQGALDEMEAEGLKLVGQYPYDLQDRNLRDLVARIAQAKPEVLFVSAYVKDGIALRRAVLAEHLPLLAMIGTSSSYCMPAFGRRLGRDAIGVFASDKPYEEGYDEGGLRPAAESLLDRAAAVYRSRYGGPMSGAALAGFSAAWALFTEVMPAASAMTPTAIGEAARDADVPMGSLPNGSGVSFGSPGTANAGANLRAASVVGEWVGVERMETVWPERYATAPIRALRLEG
jgi:branched-chain amino acid transport system substrate-binding protein